MKDEVFRLFSDHPQSAFLISLTMSILVAVLGILPSVFITAANILFFGFWQGILISFIGEALGAVVAFFLYRRGFKKITAHQLNRFSKVRALLDAKGKDAFLLILYLRLIPFVPSGFVTFAAAIGKVSAPGFITASSIGKLPALIMEGYATYEVISFNWQGKMILSIGAIFLFYFTVKQITSQKKN
ncbi:MAG: TVP38/TMEM64 family protein [Flavisolibacter sp.]